MLREELGAGPVLEVPEARGEDGDNTERQTRQQRNLPRRPETGFSLGTGEGAVGAGVAQVTWLSHWLLEDKPKIFKAPKGGGEEVA